ncbi:App1 family protein [Aestuariimicrobium ganziense]|uniref:App1 family protein n=1 Tax=Aestuariimicrobium ganziense TaxID=2773677 RepID=UPI0019448A8F|nr:phosphatase domain-containing protein [Aestuariimicrobium ganziense]
MSTRPFFGARAEERVTAQLASRFRKRGWVEAIIPYAGYGTPDQVRVLGRVVLTPQAPRTDLLKAADAFLSQRGWRNFAAVPLARRTVRVQAGDSEIEIETDRSGYLDVRLKNPGLPTGWHEVQVTTAEGTTATVPVQIIESDETLGLVSDIDDTVLSTFLPRILIAAWNSFVVTEQAREPVPGMARMYQQLLERHPGAPVVYVSTGAWNTYPFLSRFLRRHGYPQGTMLLTDWGPTNTGWFRSGPDHKRTALRELARDFPNVRWVLVGDDGQHDPVLYTEFSNLQPDKVRLIAIRQLTMAQQVLAHGTTTVLADPDDVEWTPEVAPMVKGPDGDDLAPKLWAVLDEG